MLIMTACKEKPQNTNPFFAAWDTPFEVPPFDRIDTTHFLPAFEEAMKQQAEEIAVITGNTEAPDFQNTVLAFDKSGKMLSRVSRVFFNLLSGQHQPADAGPGQKKSVRHWPGMATIFI